MHRLQRLWRRRSFLFHRRQFERDLDEEMRLHLELKAQAGLEAGLTRTEAVQSARRRFGNETLLHEVSREEWGWAWLDAAWQDLRYAWRVLCRNWGFSLVALLTLGLAIGAALAIFGVFDAIYLKKLPVPNPDSLIQVVSTDTFRGITAESFSYPLARNLRDRGNAAADLFFLRGGGLGTVRWDHSSGQEERATYVWVSGDAFRILGVHAALGRTLAASDDATAEAHPVAVISHGYWARRFGRSATVLGKRVFVDGKLFEVVGVAQAGFFGMTVGNRVDIWVPVTALGKAFVSSWNVRTFQVFGRLRNAASLNQAEAVTSSAYWAAMDAEAPARVRPEPGESAPTRIVRASRGSSRVRRDYERPVRVVLAVAALLLLTACANVASLLLANGTQRQAELAVRMGIGAGRGRLLRQLLTESMLLASAASVLGVLIALGAMPVLVRMLGTADRPVQLAFGLDSRLLAAAVGTCLGTTLLFGLWPALRASGLHIDAAIRGGQAVGTTARGGFRRGKALVSLQVAFSLALVATATLFLATLRNLKTLDPGFDRHNTLVVWLQGTAPANRQQPRGRWDEVQRRVSAIPGVERTAFSHQALFSRMAVLVQIGVQGRDVPAGTYECCGLGVSPGYFATMGTRLVMGRDLDRRDEEPKAARVAVVNQTFVRRYLHGERPLGKRISTDSRLEWNEIVGVVEDVKYDSLRNESPPMVYLPIRYGLGDMTLSVRSSLSPTALAPAIRREVAAAGNSVAVTRILPQEQLVSDTLVRERLLASLSSCFAGVALLVAAIGLFGVMSYSVARRTHEIGIRMALGARQQAVLWLILRESLAPVLVGVVAGLALVVSTTRVLGSLLFGLPATDPVAIGTAVAVLLGVGAVAGYLPARRAARIDPMVALRHE